MYSNYRRGKRDSMPSRFAARLLTVFEAWGATHFILLQQQCLKIRALNFVGGHIAMTLKTLEQFPYFSLLTQARDDPAGNFIEL